MKTPKQGLYFIYEDDIIVYIGKTTNINARTQQHSQAKAGRKYSFLPVSNQSDMALLELAFIDKLKPTGNRLDKFDGSSTISIALPDITDLPRKFLKFFPESCYRVGKSNLVNISSNPEKPNWQKRGIDFIDELVSMSTAEQRVVKLVKDNFTKDRWSKATLFEVTLPGNHIAFNKELPDTMAYSTFLKAFKLLHKKDLMRRTGKHKYMLNPKFFLLTGEQIMYFQNIWDQAKPFSKESG